MLLKSAIMFCNTQTQSARPSRKVYTTMLMQQNRRSASKSDYSWEVAVEIVISRLILELTSVDKVISYVSKSGRCTVSGEAKCQRGFIPSNRHPSPNFKCNLIPLNLQAHIHCYSRIIEYLSRDI